MSGRSFSSLIRLFCSYQTIAAVRFLEHQEHNICGCYVTSTQPDWGTRVQSKVDFVKCVCVCLPVFLFALIHVLMLLGINTKC